MADPVQIAVFGKFIGGIERDSQEGKLPISDSIPVEQLLRRVGIPRESVNLVMVNHRAVTPQARVCPGDRVSVFSREYPIFADWLAQRL